MSTTVKYKGSTITTLENETKKLTTKGTWLEDDIEITDTGGSGSAISVVDTLDSHGGTIRTISAVDISDTTATASDVAQGKYFYTANGTKTAGTASVGSSLIKHTGSFTPASDTTSLVVTGLENPAIIAKFCIQDHATNAADGVTKIVSGTLAHGTYDLTRTNGSGTGTTRAGVTSFDDYLSDRVIYEDNELTLADGIMGASTTTGFVFFSNNLTYAFRSGYTYNWICYTYPE